MTLNIGTMTWNAAWKDPAKNSGEASLRRAFPLSHHVLKIKKTLEKTPTPEPKMPEEQTPKVPVNMEEELRDASLLVLDAIDRNRCNRYVRNNVARTPKVLFDAFS